MVRETSQSASPLLSFWVMGDLHYCENEQWKQIHEPRMEQMFCDLRAVWDEEGEPAFCVSPGDIVENGALENYALARQEILAHLGSIPFYPGLGNHEYFPTGFPTHMTEDWHTAEEYIMSWKRLPCYAWSTDAVVCIMLDHPPHQNAEDGTPLVLFSQETLNFLEKTMGANPERIAIIFAHCPLYNTVLDRDPVSHLDDNSLVPYFFVTNSQEVRAILARHTNAALYISGHTHSGWGSPQLILREDLGTNVFTDVNVMSPWYTGFTGPQFNVEQEKLEFVPDSPDVQVTFSFRVYPQYILVRARDHQSCSWLAQWEIPLEAI